MADPVSIISAISAALSIAKVCTQAVSGLGDVMARWQDAPVALKGIEREYRTLKDCVESIGETLEQMQQQAINATTALEPVVDALELCHGTFRKVEKAINEIRPNVANDKTDRDGIRLWQRIKQAISGETLLQSCLNDLRWHVTIVRDLEKTLRLSSLEEVARETIQTVRDIRRHQKQSNDAESVRSLEAICKEIRITPVATSTGREAHNTLSDYPARPQHQAPALANTAQARLAQRYVRPTQSRPTQSMHAQSRPTQSVPTNSRSRQSSFPQEQRETVFSPCVIVYIAILCLGILLSILLYPSESLPSMCNEKTKSDLQKYLLKAAAKGKSKTTLEILQCGISTTIRDHEGRTPLHKAAENGHYNTVEILLQRNIGWEDDHRVTPLHLAAQNGHTRVVKLIHSTNVYKQPRRRADVPLATQRLKQAVGELFAKKFRRTFFDNKTFSPRELAAIFGHEETALAFPLSWNDDDILNAISCACMMGNSDMVERLWRKERRQLLPRSFSKPGRAQRWFPAPPLHLAVMAGDRRTVDFLLEEGVSPDDQYAGGKDEAMRPYSSPGHYAAMTGSYEVLFKLKGRKADLLLLDHEERTPLSYAVENCHFEAVKFLIEKVIQQGPTGNPIHPKGAIELYLGAGHKWPKASGGIRFVNQEIPYYLKKLGIQSE